MRLLQLFAVCTTAAAALPHGGNSTYRDAALRAANWIVASAQRAPYGFPGLYWPQNITGQTILTDYNRTFDLYSGSAGVIVFLLEAYTVSNDTTYLNTAAAAGSYLAAAVPDIIASGTSTGLYHGGAAGMAFALHTLYEATRDASLLAPYAALVQYVFASAVPSGGGDDLNPFSGLRWGTAGIGLFLLSQASLNGSYLGLAEAAAVYLTSIGVPAPGGGLFWMSDFGNANLPNYAEGTAGVAYFLAALAEVTGNATYLNTSLRGGAYLLSIANRTGGRCLIFHDNETSGLFYLANCNGPAGTGRFFLRLAHVAGDDTWQGLAMEGAQALRDLAPYPGGGYNWYVDFAQAQPNSFWNNVGLCDGSGAAIVYFMTLYQALGRAADLQFALDVANDVLAAGTITPDGLQQYWVTTEWRTNPLLSTAPQVGYMQGAAGLGSTFLQLDAVLNGTPNPHILLPDDVFTNGWD